MTKMLPSAVLTRQIDLSDLTLAGSAFEIEADSEVSARLAKWANVLAVPAFRAQVTVKRLSETRFSFQANLTADVEQACVVTLEPVTSRLEHAFRRELLYVSQPAQNHGELTLAAGDDEAPDVIDSLRYDIAAPVLEEFLLNIDPYPRKKGAVFAAPDADPSQESPFAVLKAWKKNDEA